MRLLSYGFWVIVGAGLAFIFLKSQSWSVKVIHPDREKLSKWIIVGGAFIRWALIFLVFYLALADSMISLMIVFGSFMVSRLLMLFKIQSLKHIEPGRIKSME